jgi:two-component system alkaline phosphatase synthesis response regulator PhoP
MADKKKKILVVDDEVEFLEMIKMRLLANNYDVVTAIDGKDALDKVRDEKPDAVLLDILMPGINGIDVLKKIRTMNEKLPVFIITAFSNEERFGLANKFNASGFILKTNDLQGEIQNITSALSIADRYKK